MPEHSPHLLGFAAFSGTGKTTLLIQLIPILKQTGLRVGVIKHSHHDFEIDYPGKDSFQLRAAGGTPIMISSTYRQAIITEHSIPQPIDFASQLAAFPGDNVDLILVEGFRNEEFAKIECHRPRLGKPLLYPNDSQIIAIASDQTLNTTPPIPALDLNRPKQIAEFIISHISQLS